MEPSPSPVRPVHRELSPWPSSLPQLLGFAGVVLLVALVSAAVLGSPSFLHAPDVLTTAVLVDVLLIVPVAWYFLVVRGAGWPWFSVLPVFIGCTLLASTLLAEHTALAVTIRWLALPAELALIWIAARGVGRIISEYRRHPSAERSFAEHFPPAVEAVLGSRPPARALAGELVLLNCALLGWRAGPYVPEGATPYWSHRDTAWPAIFVGMLIVMVIEVVAVHLLVALWRPEVAWALSGLGLYGILWLVGDLRALALRPTLVTQDLLRVRVGLRWNADIPIAAIREIRPFRPDREPADLLSLVVVGSPRWVVLLDRPVEVRGLLGIRRFTNALGLQVDGTGFPEAVHGGGSGGANDPQG